MNETESIQVKDEPAVKWQDLYSPVMIGVLIVFVACEGLFFLWSAGPEFTDGMFYGFEGLLLAGVFFVTRCSRVYGTSCWLSLLRALLLVAAGFMALQVFGLLAPEKARRMARRSACGNNLKQIGLALQNYRKDLDNFRLPLFWTSRDNRCIAGGHCCCHIWS